MCRLNEEELIDFENGESYICGYEFYEGNKVRDHDHLTGKYRDAAHSDCNLNDKNPTFLPVHIRNLVNYDVLLFIKELGNDTQNIDVMPNKEEKYINFSKELNMD